MAILMCGRYVSPDSAAIEREWHIGRTSGNPFPRRFNVLPTKTIPIIRANSVTGEFELLQARWGFIPQWWKEAKPPKQSFNARCEEVSWKPMWRHSYRYARCLIPAEGWYEWQAAERADPETGEIKPYRQPHFIFRPDRKLICFAGIMCMKVPKEGQSLLTCAILTKEAAPSVASVHDRMPVVLSSAVFDRWLNADIQKGQEVAMLVRNASGDFEHHAVSTNVNTAANDDESLLEQV